MPQTKDILNRLKAGESIPMDDPDYPTIRKEVNRRLSLTRKLDISTDVDEVQQYLGEIIGEEVDESTTVFPPFYTNVGRHIRLGRNVFINHGCSFLDLGGITIEDEVMVGTRVNITSENHLVEIADRKTLIPGAECISFNYRIFSR